MKATVAAVAAGAAGLALWRHTTTSHADVDEPRWWWWLLSRRGLLDVAIEALPHPLDEWVWEDLSSADMSFGAGQCPYLHGAGTCRSGCWEEPACVTSRPAEGWPTRPPGWRDAVSMLWRAFRDNRDILAEEWAWAPKSWAR